MASMGTHQERGNVFFLYFLFDGLQIGPRRLIAIDVVAVPIQAPLIPPQVFIHQMAVDFLHVFPGDLFDDPVDA